MHAGYTVGRARRADRRARRPRRGVRRPVRAGQGDLREARLHPAAHRGLRRRAGRDLAGAQGGVRGGRAHLPRLLRAGRRRAPHPARRGARPDRARWATRPGCGWPTSSTRATATCTPWCSTTPTRARPSGPSTCPAAIAELCVEMGGSLSGEHGIGTDKACSMPRMFSEDDLAVMQRVRAAFDPDGPVQPGQGVPHAAPVRRAPRQVPGRIRWRPPARSRGCTMTSAATVLRPQDLGEVAGRAPRHHRPAPDRGRGHGGRRGPGRSAPVDAVLDTTALTGVITHNPGDMTVSVRAGTPLRGAARRAGRARAARVAGRGADRRGRHGRRPARHRRRRARRAGVRLAARRRHRRHARAGRRHGRPRGRPRDQERGGLRPGEGRARLLRHARRGRRGGAAAAPRAQGRGHGGAAVLAGRGGGGRGPRTRRPHRARCAGVDQRRPAPAADRRHRRRAGGAHRAGAGAARGGARSSPRATRGPGTPLSPAATRPPPWCGSACGLPGCPRCSPRCP